MPRSIIAQHTRSQTGSSTAQGPENCFTGQVFLDTALKNESADPSDRVMSANVVFTPSARTNWHTHEKGQLLQVNAGSGWICDKGDKPRKINVGDTIWYMDIFNRIGLSKPANSRRCEPGTTHWHGADDGSVLVHFVVSLGATTWLEPVTNEEYSAKAT